MLKLAILGTRGIPASYGGFETFAEELSTRLVGRGHAVTVYCRSHHTPRHLREVQGVRLVVLPTIRHKYLDTICHTLLSSLHAAARGYDVALYCNAANALFLPLPRLRGTKVAINIDGLEWQRRKWNWLGRQFHRVSERLACSLSHALITDAQVIQAYYQRVHGAESEFIPYGAPTEKARTREALSRFGLEPERYFLYVGRLEPENNPDRVIEAFRRLKTDLRLVIVGDAPYARRFIRKLHQSADERVVFTGYVFGHAYRELISHAYCAIHATEVGGTHPALLEAMGLGNGILVSDVPENREVVQDGALFFTLRDPEDLLGKMELALEDRQRLEALAEVARQRVRRHYTWDSVAARYESLFLRLAAGRSQSAPEAAPRRKAEQDAIHPGPPPRQGP